MQQSEHVKLQYITSSEVMLQWVGWETLIDSRRFGTEMNFFYQEGTPQVAKEQWLGPSYGHDIIYKLGVQLRRMKGMACIQCSRLKSSMPFKRDLVLQNIQLSKQPFKTQPQIENENLTWSPQYNMSVKHCSYKNWSVNVNCQLTLASKMTKQCMTPLSGIELGSPAW